MSRRNNDIRDYAKSKNVYLWQVAEVLKIHDNIFSRKLRYELKPEEKTEIFNIIDKLAAEST